VTLHHIAEDFDQLARMLQGHLGELHRPQFRQEAATLAAEIRAHVRTRHTIADDAMLSDAGRRTRREEAERKLGARFDSLLATAEKIRSETATKESAVLKRLTFVPPADPAARVGYEARAREVRDQLRPFEKAVRTDVYERALESGDYETAAALEGAPPTAVVAEGATVPRLEPFLDAAKADAARKAAARRRDPAAARDVDSLQALAQAFETLTAWARAQVLGDAPAAPRLVDPATGSPIADVAPPKPAPGERLHDGRGGVLPSA
jgi:hypothetical protein